MSMSQLCHWEIMRPPFETALEADFFFSSEDHREAISRIEFLVRQPGSQLGLLTGEIGCGKSLTRAVFAERCTGHRLIAQISSSHYPFVALLRSVLIQIGVPDPGPTVSEYDLMQRFCEIVETGRKPVVLLFDEAQELDCNDMKGIRALNNLADGLLDVTIILLGQPELRQKIQALPQLDQRAGLRYHLCSLKENEVSQYLTHRLIVAGHQVGDIFTQNACRLIADESGGVPRNVNRLACLAMSVAKNRSSAWVEERDIRIVSSDLRHQKKVIVA